MEPKLRWKSDFPMTTPGGGLSIRHCLVFLSCTRCTVSRYSPEAGEYDCCASTTATLVPVSVNDVSLSCSRPTGGTTTAPGPSSSTVVDSPGCHCFAALRVRYLRAVS